MLKKILSDFGRLVVKLTDEAEHQEKPKINLELDTKLMTKIDASRLDALEKLMAVVAVNLHKLIDEQKRTQEYLVHLSTLHEELLNHLEQNNVAIVKVRRNNEDDSQFGSREGDEMFDDIKKKTELN
jgi:hypothetical protein